MPRRRNPTENGQASTTTRNTRLGCHGWKTSISSGSAQITRLRTRLKVPPPLASHHRQMLRCATDTLGKTKVTGIEQVDHLQDGVNDLVGGQVGKGGLLQPIGDMASKQGINRIERQGKDDKGTYGGPAASIADPAIQNAQKAGSGVTEGAKGGVSYVTESAKGAGSYLGGFLGGKKEEKK